MNNDLKQRIARMPDLMMYRSYKFPDYDYDSKHLRELELLVDELEKIFSFDESKVQEILGGEFKIEGGVTGHGIELPLYFHIDLIIIAVENNMKDTVRLSERKEQIVDRLKKLREKASRLDYNDFFDSTKHLSERAIENISSSRGNYSFDYKNYGYERFLKYSSTDTYEDIEYKNGDYIPRGSSYLDSDGLVFKEDIDYLHNKEVENERISKPILEEVSECFINGKVVEPIEMSYFTSFIKGEYRERDFIMTLRNLLHKIFFPYSDANLFDISIDELYRNYKEQKAVLDSKKQEEPIEEETEYVFDELSDKRIIDDKKPNDKKRRSIFSRFKGLFTMSDEAASQMDAINDFEDARIKQIKDDEEVRNVVMYERRMENGREVLVPLSNEEYKVVKR